MEKSYHSYTLLSGQVVKGNVSNIGQLSVKFQRWARLYGLDDSTSLACWIANQPTKHSRYFQKGENVLELAKAGFEKIKGVEIPDLS